MLNRINVLPSQADFSGYIRNPLFETFCETIREQYQIEGKPEYSRCSWEPGWNMKFKKSGRTLCTLYPRENYFTLMVVIGKKEKAALEAAWEELSEEIRHIYEGTKEGNGQRWLMIDLEDEDQVYRDALRLISFRR